MHDRVRKIAMTLAASAVVTVAAIEPSANYLLELFKITPQGKIRQVEAVFMAVPYRMTSPWMAGD